MGRPLLDLPLVENDPVGAVFALVDHTALRLVTRPEDHDIFVGLEQDGGVNGGLQRLQDRCRLLLLRAHRQPTSSSSVVGAAAAPELAPDGSPSSDTSVSGLASPLLAESDARRASISTVLGSRAMRRLGEVQTAEALKDERERPSPRQFARCHMPDHVGACTGPCRRLQRAVGVERTLLRRILLTKLLE